MTKKLKFVKEIELELDALMQPIALLGNRGGGKTYAGTALFEVSHDAGVQCVAIDGIGKWWALRQDKDGHGPGLADVFIFGGKRGDFPLSPEKGAFVAKVLVEKRVSAVLDVSLMRKGDRRRFVTDFAEEFYLLKKQADVADPCILFLEEAHQFIPQKPQPDEARMLGAFEDIVSEGRNAGLGVVVMDQRPARANKNVLALVELLVVLRTTYKSDRDVYADWIVQRAAEDAAEVDLHKTLPFLKAGHGYLYAPLYEQFGKVTVLPKRTFDSSATAKVGVAVKQIGTLTPVDVAQLTEAMAEVVADAEQKNPELLKRRIRQLEAELAAKPKAPPPIDLTPFAHQAEELSRQLGALYGGPLQEHIRALRAGVATGPLLVHLKRKRYLADGTAIGEIAVTGGRPATPSQPTPKPMVVTGDAAGLKKGAREMLRELVALHRILNRPLSRRELGVRAVMVPSGGTVGDYLRSIAGAGLLVETEIPGEAGFEPTPAGMKAMNGATPKGLDELVELWMPSFKAGAQKMFRDLVDHPGEVRTRAHLADAAGMDVSGGTVGDYIRHLQKSGVAEKVTGGSKLADCLSLGGA